MRRPAGEARPAPHVAGGAPRGERATAPARAGPILSTGDIMREEQYHARGMFHEVRSALPNPTPRTVRITRDDAASCTRIGHARRGSPEPSRPQAQPPSGGPPVTVPAVVPKLSGTPGGTRWAGPELGEHTDAVLREELGLSDAELARLRSAGAI